MIRPYVYSDEKKQFTDHDFEEGLRLDREPTSSELIKDPARDREKYGFRPPPRSENAAEEMLPAIGKGRTFGLLSFIEYRAAWMDAKLNDYAEITDLIISEYGDTWVEVYNLGPGLLSTVDLSVTDDNAIPDKWGLPERKLNDGESIRLDNIRVTGDKLSLYIEDDFNYKLIYTTD